MYENQKFYLVKVREDNTDIINRLQESVSLRKERYYNLNSVDKSIEDEIDEVSYTIVFVIFKYKDEKYIPNRIFLGKAHLNNYKSKTSLKYFIEKEIASDLVIKNFIYNLGIDLKNDFETNSYVSIETSTELLHELEFSCKEMYQYKYEEDVPYMQLEEEKNYDELSQKNEYCKRVFSKKESNQECRGEFQIDREKIIHSKSFRRLVDKAQIFTSSKGDHYRTRMTHTLEVAQIAKGISIALKLNNELTEAIALAHDIGHTPFGHQGERTIDDILKGKIDIIKNCDELKNGGFKHNFQSVRVVSYSEESYLEFEGINLSYQVLEGILKHTKLKQGNCEVCDKCDKKCFNIDEFFKNGDKKFLYLEYEYSTTLEGQIVSIADEIAQRSHDLDDALASKHIDIDELIKYCGIKKMKKLKDVFEKLKNDLIQIESENRMLIDRRDMIRARIVSEVITFFIKDVIESSREKMEKYKNDLDENVFFNENYRVNEILITFTTEGKFILEYLENIINKKVINSFDVSRFDQKAGEIVMKLFKAYYNNLRILPDSTLRRIYREIRKVSNNVIDFRNGDIGLVRDEIYKICLKDIKDLDSNEKEEYIEKRRIVVRNIADHIAGMTDNYAIAEYNRICDL
ncbi:deoxyguanosinetriphosphate triphosphohydrolase family protein [Clostridium neonatale]|uniref:deoxyguanosinetriphosphate triphosphohydrolase family protein n=1 Tax=Clostridium neonatale TaxID=137838 RepID=UPI00291B7916|nr:dNTP triphosphohydrolase [Clostridium neonatale]CAI3202444.1 dGTPase [Clostridium neonatale]CAI3211235.1 dGTPase [Clostridium neonatale]